MPDTEALERLARTSVRTDDDVVALALALLDGPITRQCWVLFIGEHGLPVQFAMPIADLPYEPDEHVEDFGALVADLMVEVTATEAVLIWERPNATCLYPVDWEWVDAMECTLREHGVRLRGQVVLHDGGAAMVELEDHDEPGEVAA